MRPDTQRRYPLMTWRRMLAHQEARALRAYLAATGRYPTHQPTDWNLA